MRLTVLRAPSVTFSGRRADRRLEISPISCTKPNKPFPRSSHESAARATKKNITKNEQKIPVNKAGARNKNGPSSGKARRRCGLYVLYNDRFLWSDPRCVIVGPSPERRAPNRTSRRLCDAETRRRRHYGCPKRVRSPSPKIIYWFENCLCKVGSVQP